MDRVRRLMSRNAHVLMIAMAILGIEVDVISNPFSPEFVLGRLFAIVDGTPAEARDASADQSNAPDRPVASSADGEPMSVCTDETVALRPRVKWPTPIHAFASSSMPSLLMGHITREPVHPALPEPRQVSLNGLCRYLC